MKISRKNMDSDFEQWRSWHVLTFAKPLYGLSALDFYARIMHGIATEDVDAFAGRVNREGMTGSLFPKAPVSAVPYHYLAYAEDHDLVKQLDDFTRYIKEFVEANRAGIHAKKILVDFHQDADPVPDFFLTTAEKAFNQYLGENEVDEIVLFR
jgi:hypothetical protein